MSEIEHNPATEHDPRATRFALVLFGAGGLSLLGAGLLLWWREGDKLFTDGLIAAILACF